MNAAAPKLTDRLAGCAVLPPMADGPRQDPTPDRRTVDCSKTPEGTAPAKGRASRRRTGERFELLNGFVDFTAGKLNRSELLVWLTLYRDCRDGVARSGQADVARRTGLGERTVRWAITQLERRGLLEVVRRGGLNRGPSSYRVRALDESEELRQ